MIQDDLDNEIYSHISKTGKDINLIVMHPQTWITLTKDVFENDSMAIYRHERLLKYKGVRVLRSLDMVEGLFEVR